MTTIWRRAGLPLALCLCAFGANAQTRGWLSTAADGDVAGIAKSGSGARFAIGNTVVDAAVSGDIHPLFSVPLRIERMTSAGNDLLFLCEAPLKTFTPNMTELMVKTDATGKVLWAREVRGVPTGVWLTTITTDANGSIYAAGTYGQGIAIVKLSPDGELVWQRSLDHSDVDRVDGLSATRDGGALIAGSVYGLGFIARVNADGSLRDDHVFRKPNGGAGFGDVVELPNGDILAAGTESRGETGDYEGVLIRIGPRGNIVWQKSIGGDGEDQLRLIAAQGPNRYSIMGTTDSFATPHRTLLVTIDGEGNVLGTSTLESSGKETTRSALIAAGQNGVWIAAAPKTIGLFSESMSCSSVKHVKLRSRTTDLVRTDRPAEFGEGGASVAPTTIDPVKEAEIVTKPACAADAAPAAVERAVVDQNDRFDSLRFAIEVAKMLVDEKFAALDALAAKLRKTKEQSPEGNWKLPFFYAAFDAEMKPLAPLGVDRTEKLLEKWVHTTNSATSRVALATFEDATAWQARGGGYANTITADAAKQLDRRTNRAIELLDQVHEQGQCDPACLTEIISAKELGGWSGPLREVLRTEPSYWYAFRAAGNFLQPKWGGSPGALEQFAREAADATRLFFGEAMYGIVIEVGPWADVGTEPFHPVYDWPRLRTALFDYHSRYPASEVTVNAIAYFAWRHRDQKTAKQAFENPRLRWRQRSGYWKDHDEFDKAKAWAMAPVESSGATVTSVDVSVNGKPEHAVAFMVERDGQPMLVSSVPHLLPDRDDPSMYSPSDLVRRKGVTFSRAGQSLKTLTAATDGRKASAIVTFPNEIAPLRTLAIAPTMTVGDEATVVACGRVTTPCTEVRAVGQIVGGGDYGLLFRTEPPDDIGDAVGSPILNGAGQVIGVVRYFEKRDASVLMWGDVLDFALKQARVPIQTNP